MANTSVSICKCKAAHLYDTTGTNGVIYRMLRLEAYGSKCYVVSAESNDCQVIEALGPNLYHATEFYEKIIRGDVSPENLTELVTDFKNSLNY